MKLEQSHIKCCRRRGQRLSLVGEGLSIDGGLGVTVTPCCPWTPVLFCRYRLAALEVPDYLILLQKVTRHLHEAQSYGSGSKQERWGHFCILCSLLARGGPRTVAKLLYK